MKLSRFRLVTVLLSFLFAVWVTIYAHSFNFSYIAQYDCSVYVTTQGEPISFRTTSVEQSSFGNTCPEEAFQQHRNQSVRPLSFMADIGIWFLLSFSILTAFLWIAHTRLTNKRAGLLEALLKSMVVGLLFALLARFLFPPQYGAYLNSFGTIIAEEVGFIVGFIASFCILLLRWRQRIQKH